MCSAEESDAEEDGHLICPRLISSPSFYYCSLRFVAVSVSSQQSTAPTANYGFNVEVSTTTEAAEKASPPIGSGTALLWPFTCFVFLLFLSPSLSRSLLLLRLSLARIFVHTQLPFTLSLYC